MSPVKSSLKQELREAIFFGAEQNAAVTSYGSKFIYIAVQATTVEIYAPIIFQSTNTYID